jgi:hypothetical protein
VCRAPKSEKQNFFCRGRNQIFFRPYLSPDDFWIPRHLLGFREIQKSFAFNAVLRRAPQRRNNVVKQTSRRRL